MSSEFTGRDGAYGLLEMQQIESQRGVYLTVSSRHVFISLPFSVFTKRWNRDEDFTFHVTARHESLNTPLC
jgi:hypothetical protein